MIKKLFVGTFGVALNVIIYILVILLAIRVITWSYDFAYEVFGDRPVAEASEEIVPVQISDGASTNEIAAILDKKGLIKYKYAFIIHVGLSQYKGMLKPGNYELSPSMTMDQMLAVMAGSGTAEKRQQNKSGAVAESKVFRFCNSFLHCDAAATEQKTAAADDLGM